VESPIVADPSAAPLRMTFEEFLAFDCEHGLAEWVIGEVFF
jgi:hypothetical protein